MIQTTSMNRRSGLTLVELLVVIAIMGLLTALIVPQVRLINKDRNIREAARVVGTALTQARDRAVATGAAGLQIERNTNITDGDVCYAGTRLYLMRKVPNYQDAAGAIIDWNSAPGQVQIRLPYGWEPGMIQPGDRIRFDHSSVRYPITHTPTLGGLGLGLRIGLSGGVLPIPRSGNNIPFVVERSPRRIESSRVDLPDGYIIDLRYSGYWDGQTTDFAITPTLDVLGNPVVASGSRVAAPIELIFNSDGGLDRLNVQEKNAGLQPNDPPRTPYMARGSVDLFVTEYRPDAAGLSGVPAAQQILANPAALWVTLSDKSGGVNVGYNAPPDNNASPDLQSLILFARGASRDRSSAKQ